MKPFSAVRAYLLVAALGIAGVTAAPVIAQQGAAKPAAAGTDTPAGLEAFEYGMAAVQSGKYERAVEYFVTAARGGDSDDMVSAPHKRSRKPEVWFNLALAESKVPGFELHAIAAFKYYLVLSPRASNAEAIKQQIRTLEIAAIDEISAAAEKVAALIPPHFDGKDYMRRGDSRETGADLLRIYLSLGDRRRALNSMDRYVDDWRTKPDGALVRAAVSDAQTWALFPPARYIPSEKLAFDLEAGDFDAAVRTIEGQQSMYGGLYQWLDVACVAGAAGRKDVVETALDAALKVKITGDPYDSDRGKLALILFELGRVDDARAVLDVMKYPRRLERVKEIFAGVETQTLKECASAYGGGRSRWYSGGRPHYLQNYALNPQPLSAQMAHAASEYEFKTIQDQTRRVLEYIAFRADEFRYIHGPWPPT